MSVLQGKSYTKGEYTFSLECDVPIWKLWVYHNGDKNNFIKGSENGMFLDEINKYLED